MCAYGVATISRLLKMIGLFCQRAQLKRRYSAKETCNFKERTNRSHPMDDYTARVDICTHKCSDTCIRTKIQSTNTYTHIYQPCIHTYIDTKMFIYTHIYTYIDAEETNIDSYLHAYIHAYIHTCKNTLIQMLEKRT